MYQLSDFKPNYTWYKSIGQSIFCINKGTKGWMYYQSSGSWKECKTVHSFHQMKAYLSLFYGIESTGWRAYSIDWISEDEKWTLNKSSYQWYVSDDNRYWNERAFKTRQAAIDWINKQESCDVPA